MKIQVKNLGTIKEGTVELSKNLIIFTGQNNTGKSYMAYLIYGLYTMEASLMTKIFASKTITPTIKISDNKPLPNSIHFFPAERSAINMLAKEVFREKASKLDEISQKLLADDDLESVVKSIKQKGELVPRYPLAVSDYLFFINDLAYISKNESDFADFADEIETMLLQGKVSISEHGDIKFTPGEAKQLDMHLCSSLVKSLSGLVLYFRHVAQKNDVIMMDEPELNLHPDSQRIVASILAKAVNRGFKLILSTHSDYIIKEFNNLIMLNRASETDLEELNYDKEAVLDKEKISAYFFTDSTIEPIEVSDTGLSIKTIDATIDRLDNAMESIYYKLFER